MAGQFQVGGTLRKDKFYIKRDADDLLYDAIQENEFCYVLSSRQIGKSSLMARTARRLREEGFLVAVLDITGSGDTNGDASKFYNYVFKKICRGAKVPFDETILDYENETLGQNFETLIDYILSKTTEKICVFIDEIDKIIDLNENDFDTDGFFSFLRYIKNKSAEKAIYERINFVVLGVATPSDLIKNKERTPFNIGTKIELKNFTFDEAKLLLPGLEPHFEESEELLRSIITWTGGQPYLTQRFCQLAIDHKEHESPNDEAFLEWVANRFFINEAETEPNLSNIRDRILKNEDFNFEMLLLLKKITNDEAVTYDSKNKAQEYLKLTGLVNNKGQKLAFTNRIYKEVFTKEWVEDKFNYARFPFKKELLKWENDERGTKHLLKGFLLDDAIEWLRKTNDVSITEKDFIEASREVRDKNREREKRRRWIYFGLLGLGILVFFSLSVQAYAEKARANALVAVKELELNNLRSEVKYTQLKLEGLQATRDSAQIGIDTLRVSIDKEADSLQNVMAQTIEELNKYKSMAEDYRNKSNEAEKSSKNLKDRQEKLEYTIRSLQNRNERLQADLKRYQAGNLTFLEVEKGESYIITEQKSEFSKIVLRPGASLVIDDKLTSAEITAQSIEFYNNATIDGRGSNGKDGKSGLSGSNGKDCQPGVDGRRGQNGTNGSRGKLITLNVRDIIQKGNDKLLIDVRGGNGGDGGNGGHGGYGGRADCSENCHGANGGNGGDSGQPGSGGRQGDVKISNPSNAITIIAKRGSNGKEGLPGDGGLGGLGKKCVFYTKKHGKNGQPGNTLSDRKSK